MIKRYPTGGHFVVLFYRQSWRGMILRMHVSNDEKGTDFPNIQTATNKENY